MRPLYRSTSRDRRERFKNFFHNLAPRLADSL